MKTNKYLLTLAGFLAGTVFGITTIVFLSFTNGPAAPAPGAGAVRLSAAEAHTFFVSYISGAVPYNQVMKGFNVGKSQLDAMNAIAAENPSLTGFRIYFGKDNDSRTIGIVVGVDNTGIDAIKNSIFSTDGAKPGPCPPICDVASPITLGV